MKSVLPIAITQWILVISIVSSHSGQYLSSMVRGYGILARLLQMNGLGANGMLNHQRMANLLKLH